MIDCHNQSYWWNSNGEHGDVIEWVMKRRGWDFRSAVEYLCKRAGLVEPDWSKQDPALRVAARAREDALNVASDLFHKWLLADPAALAYVRGRGWTDETIKRARLGFTGNRADQERLQQEMQGAMATSGVDPRAPAAVSILGLGKNVRNWAIDYGVTPQGKWIDEDRIFGVVGWDRLVYAHMLGGCCVLFYIAEGLQKAHFIYQWSW